MKHAISSNSFQLQTGFNIHIDAKTIHRQNIPLIINIFIPFSYNNSLNGHNRVRGLPNYFEHPLIMRRYCIIFDKLLQEYPNGIFNLGEEYQDSCGSENNCMSMLSLQVLVLMIAKPIPKFAKDILIP